ncbi:hypothetical protein PSP6_280118 [Paraburkholderia tropica]|nr:hypothetical protein PSP6_280118 [Paraburkholderia tropica]
MNVQDVGFWHRSRQRLCFALLLRSLRPQLHTKTFASPVHDAQRAFTNIATEQWVPRESDQDFFRT